MLQCNSRSLNFVQAEAGFRFASPVPVWAVKGPSFFSFGGDHPQHPRQSVGTGVCFSLQIRCFWMRLIFFFKRYDMHHETISRIQSR